MVAGAVAVAGIFVLRDDARYVYDRLTDQGLPLVILSAVCGLGALALLVRGARRGARALAVGAVVAVVWGWGVGAVPVPAAREPDDRRGRRARATRSPAVLIVFGVAVVLVLPALAFLYTLSQRSMLEGEFEKPGRRQVTERASSGRCSTQVSQLGPLEPSSPSAARSTTSRRTAWSRRPRLVRSGDHGHAQPAARHRGARSTTPSRRIIT